MQREYIDWWSPSLGRDMSLLVFGHAGTPVLAFPSSKGRFFEWEDHGMVEALGEQLESGQNRLFCVDSVDAESFYNYDAPPEARMLRHRQYEQYVMREVVPYIHSHTGQPYVIATGASFGGYHATNFAFKHPDRFGKLIALSGAFDIKPWMDAYYSDHVYFNNPVDYLHNLTDERLLDAMRRNHVILGYGEQDPCRDDNLHLSYLLHRLGLDHTMDETPGFGHDWPFWQQQLARHIA